MNRNFNRRQFLRTAAGAPAVAATGTPMAMVRARELGIVMDPADAIASAMAARWAAAELERALTDVVSLPASTKIGLRLLQPICALSRPIVSSH